MRMRRALKSFACLSLSIVISMPSQRQIVRKANSPKRIFGERHFQYGFQANAKAKSASVFACIRDSESIDSPKACIVGCDIRLPGLPSTFHYRQNPAQELEPSIAALETYRRFFGLGFAGGLL